MYLYLLSLSLFVPCSVIALVPWLLRWSPAIRRQLGWLRATSELTLTSILARTASYPLRMLGLDSGKAISSWCSIRRTAFGGRWIHIHSYYNSKFRWGCGDAEDKVPRTTTLRLFSFPILIQAVHFGDRSVAGLIPSRTLEERFVAMINVIDYWYMYNWTVSVLGPRVCMLLP